MKVGPNTELQTELAAEPLVAVWKPGEVEIGGVTEIEKLELWYSPRKP